MTTANSCGLNRGDLQKVDAEWRRTNTERKARWVVLLLLLSFLTACTTSLQRKEDAISSMRLGQSMLQEGRPTQALTELIKANDLDPNNPEIRNVLGVAYLEKGMVPQAINQFEKALYLNPKYVEVHNNLGTALLQDGRIKEAIAEFNKALFCSIQLGSGLFRPKGIRESQGALSGSHQSFSYLQPGLLWPGHVLEGHKPYARGSRSPKEGH
jgi:tetratricopeptide (TPR) repeat protein